MQITPLTTGTTTTTGLSDRQAAKLTDSAQQFEAMFLNQMLKPLHFGSAPGDDDNEDASGGANGTLRDMGTEALAKGIAKAGGFGIAKQVIRQVAAQHEQTETKQHSTKV